MKRYIPIFLAVACVVAIGAGMLVLGHFRPFSQARQDGKRPSIDSGNIDFQLKDLNGRLVDFAEVRKDKVVILKFGTMWCSWCRKQSEDFRKIEGKLDPANVVLFEVSLGNDNPVDQVRSHAQEEGVKHTIVRDDAGAVAQQYKVDGWPTVVVIDRKGRIVYRGYYTPVEQLQKAVDEALARG